MELVLEIRHGHHLRAFLPSEEKSAAFLRVFRLRRGGHFIVVFPGDTQAGRLLCGLFQWPKYTVKKGLAPDERLRAPAESARAAPCSFFPAAAADEHVILYPLASA